MISNRSFCSVLTSPEKRMFLLMVVVNSPSIVSWYKFSEIFISVIIQSF
jgi:hypothetical protein